MRRPFVFRLVKLFIRAGLPFAVSVLFPVAVAWLFVAMVARPAVDVWAAPAGQEARPVIAQPPPDAAVRGVVQIVGTATHPQFQRYELYYAPWPVPSDQSWIFIGDAHFNQQPLGLLGTWDSRSVPDGAYALRVRVVKVDGNYLDSDPRRVLVVNTRPLASPTPVATDTPVPVPTVVQPTPTTVIEVLPPAESPTPEPTSTPEPEVTPILPVGGAVGTDRPAQTDGTPATQLIDGQRLLYVARQSAFYTLAAFVAVGVFFGVKAVLVWLWYKIRP